MNVIAWIVQALLAAVFLGHSWISLIPRQRERLREGMGYLLDMPAGVRLFSGVTEGLAAIGLIVPPLVGSASWLSPLAASGLVVLMLGAMAFHFQRREYPNVAFNGVLLSMAVFVAVIRWAVEPF